VTDWTGDKSASQQSAISAQPGANLQTLPFAVGCADVLLSLKK
jgi:hypothetical protein